MKHARRTVPAALVNVGGYEALAAAVIWQAVQDARDGDAAAAAWLAGDGTALLAYFMPDNTAPETAVARVLETLPPARPQRPRTHPARGIGVIVRAARRQAGLSQRELARRAGMPHARVSNIELGKQHPRPATLARLARALGMPETAFTTPVAA